MAKGKKTGGRDWKPGESGNPNGRPKNENSLSNLLRKELEETDPDTGLANKEVIAKALVRLARGDNLAAIEKIFDRLEGKPAQTIDQHVYQEENPVLDALRGIIDGAESETDNVPEGE